MTIITSKEKLEIKHAHRLFDFYQEEVSYIRDVLSKSNYKSNHLFKSSGKQRLLEA